jgi:hypothetical protein
MPLKQWHWADRMKELLGQLGRHLAKLGHCQALLPQGRYGLSQQYLYL